MSSRAVLVVTFGFLGLVGAAVAGLGAYYVVSTPPSMFPAVRTAPSPRIAFPASQAGLLRDAQLAAVQGRAVAAGRLPIERAMAVIAARGSSAFDPVAGGASEASEARPEARP